MYSRNSYPAYQECEHSVVLDYVFRDIKRHIISTTYKEHIGETTIQT